MNIFSVNTGVDLSEQDFGGQNLAGTYIGCNFSGANLDNASLSGTFISCDLSDSIITENTALTGTFSDITWSKDTL